MRLFLIVEQYCTIMKNKECYYSAISISLLSLCLFLIVCWTLGISGVTCIWIESISFFAFSFFAHNKHKEKLSSTFIAISIVLGRILLEVPVRLFDFYGSLCSLWITFSCVTAIILGCLCDRSNNKIAHIAVSLVIIYILNILEETTFSTFGLVNT